MKRPWALIALVLPVHAGELTSERYRMVSPIAASIAASTASPVYQAQIAGGSATGMTVSGISNSLITMVSTRMMIP